MSSTIMYKFRSSPNFEPLAMPGTSARLFDVKRGIVTAKKLDRNPGTTQLEFDLSVRNATTNEEYDDEAALLPRGTRVVVQRLPAARGHGLLSRIARAKAGMSVGLTSHQSYGNIPAAKRGYYTMESTKDDDEFVDTNSLLISSSEPSPLDEAEDEGEKELAALKAVTDSAGMFRASTTTLSRSTQPNKFGISGTLPPPPPPIHHNLNHQAAGGNSFKKAPNLHHFAQHNRPNADPELREQEKQAGPNVKKRATGIPRTFLNLIAPPANDSSNDNDINVTSKENNNSTLRLQPNVIGFQALLHRGGGQSETTSGGRRRDLKYALKITATTVPDHLQCGICKNIVKNAMLVPWDVEGRTTCEICMRDGLAQNGFRCPLTGQDGMSPDELLPNVGLRKAAEMFENGIMEKMEEIVVQQEAEELAEKEKMDLEKKHKEKVNVEITCEKRSSSKLRESIAQKKSNTEDDDLFVEEDFGGDVFDVSDGEMEKQESDDEGDMFGVSNEKVKLLTEENNCKVKKMTNRSYISDNSNKKIDDNDLNVKTNIFSIEKDVDIKDTTKIDYNNNVRNGDQSKDCDDITSPAMLDSDKTKYEKDAKVISKTSDKISKAVILSTADDSIKIGINSATSVRSFAYTTGRREITKKNRGPPAGYVMGPAGGATATSKGGVKKRVQGSGRGKSKGNNHKNGNHFSNEIITNNNNGQGSFINYGVVGATVDRRHNIGTLRQFSHGSKNQSNDGQSNCGGRGFHGPGGRGGYYPHTGGRGGGNHNNVLPEFNHGSMSHSSKQVSSSCRVDISYNMFSARRYFI